MKAKKSKKSNTKNHFWSRVWIIIRNTAIGFLIISVLWVVVDKFTPVYLTPLMCQRTTESVFQGETPRNDKSWVPITEISPNMVQAVVASEDNKFMYHSGFSFVDMQRAFTYNQKGKKIRGGSTISQQTAKNVFLFPQRSYIRKALEAYFTVLIEFIWGKERIMEMYLNVIEMGEGIYGIEAASQEYFGKSANQLSKKEAALIAACIPNPRRFKVDAPSGYVLKRQAKILELMGKIRSVDLKHKQEEIKHYRKRHR